MSGIDLQDSMMASDAFISLSHRENFGYAMCDALAHALPILVTPGHDIVRELPIGPGRGLACGWQLADDSLPTAAAAIAELCACSDAQLTEMGSNGRSWATENLSYRRFCESLTALVPGM
jgi:glycosyltransferase involved in cell wall biosynthesis